MVGMGTTSKLQCKFVRLKEGDLYLSPPRESGKYDGDNYYDSVVIAYFQNIKVLDKLVSELKHPYWVIDWILKEPINVKAIKKQLYESSPETLDLNTSNDKTFNDSLDRTIINNFNDLPLFDGIERVKSHEVRIAIGHSYLMKGKTYVGLIFGGRSEKSFFMAHSVFSPDSLLSILMGEIPMQQIRKMIKDARTMPPSESTKP